jgi:hypothetical protein
MTYTNEDDTRHKHKHKNKNKKSYNANKISLSQSKQSTQSNQRTEKQRAVTTNTTSTEDTRSDSTLEINVLSTNTNANTNSADSQVYENNEEKVNANDSSNSIPSETSSLVVNESHSVWRCVSVKSSALSLRKIQEQQRREQQHQTKAAPNEKSKSLLCDVPPPLERPSVEKCANDPVLLSDFIPFQRPSPSSASVFKEVPKSPPKSWNIQHQSENSRKVVSLREIQEQELAQKSQTMSGSGQEIGLGRMTRPSSAWAIPLSSSPARISLVDIQREEEEKARQQKRLFHIAQIGEHAVREIEEFYRRRYQDEVLIQVRKLSRNSNSQHKSDSNKQAF